MKVFIEEQKFNQPLVIAGLLIAFIAIGFAPLNNWGKIATRSIGEQIGALSGIVVLLIVATLFIFMKLKTRVDEIGIHYQFYPFHFSYKIISWKLISKCYIRKYDAISEFGGWGIKFSFLQKKRKSFTTKGNIGLQIELKSGQKILLGTQKKEELQRTLYNYNFTI